MGRYYSGDINGKFWFGVQSTDDAGFFGGDRQEPSYVTYVFDESDIKTVREGIKICKEKLGTYHKPMHDFFCTGEGKNGYTDEMLAEILKIDPDKPLTLLEWYARLQLGGKIYKCLKEKGYCEFDAEY